MTVRVSTVCTTEELESIADEWSALLVRGKNTLPFLLPEWNLVWWEFFRQDSYLIRDVLAAKVARSESGRLVGVLPFMATARPGAGLLRPTTLDFPGADPYITEQRAPAVDPACAGDVARAMADDLLADSKWDWIQWHGLTLGTPFVQALEERLPVTWGAAQPGNILRLAPSWEEFRGKLKRNIKEALRHCYNSLKRDGMTARLAVAETPDDVAAALDVFFRLHAMRAASAGGISHPDRFAGVQPKRFLRAICERLAQRRIAKLFTLHVGDTPVASRIGFLLPDCLYLYYSGFEPAWSKYSVMTTTVAEVIKYAITLGIPALHLSMGADVSKGRWGPEMPLFYDAVSVRPRLRSRAALDVYTFFRAAHRGPVAGALSRLLPRRRFD
jgi:CelD/BcsL family acetyltransferase involved in cellulose biosynthesis